MRRCAVPQFASIRLHPIAAFRAMRNLIRDREDTRQVFLLIEALRGKTTLRQLARFRQSETGRRMLAERRSLLARLSERAGLAALPSGSLGRAYYEFMAAEDLSAEGLVELSKIQRPASGDELTWFRERNREMHDLLHITAGYGRDPLGEACVTAFSYAQTGLKGFGVIATVVAFQIARRLPGQDVMRAVFEAYRQGKRAEWLIGADWESLLSQPLDAVRAQLKVSPPTHYPRILPDLRRIISTASGQTAQPAAL
jgi:ubiquinone biosynthesis protein COQ4